MEYWNTGIMEIIKVTSYRLTTYDWRLAIYEKKVLRAEKKKRE
jgi:hypothetical protein